MRYGALPTSITTATTISNSRTSVCRMTEPRSCRDVVEGLAIWEALRAQLRAEPRWPAGGWSGLLDDTDNTLMGQFPNQRWKSRIHCPKRPLVGDFPSHTSSACNIEQRHDPNNDFPERNPDSCERMTLCFEHHRGLELLKKPQPPPNTTNMGHFAL